MKYDDQWFYENLRNNKINNYAQTAFKAVHGSEKKPEITLEVFNKNLDQNYAKKCQKALEKLDYVVDNSYADLVRYCAVTYANFCDEIYAGLDDFYFQSITMEWLLHSESGYAQRRYRDHLTHQLKVTLLGVDFLDGTTTGTALMPDVIDKLKTSSSLASFLQSEDIQENVIDSNLVMASWLLAGMFHDIGYCFVMHMKTAKQLSGVSGFFNYDFSEEIWNKVDKFITEHSYITAFYRANGLGFDNNTPLSDVKNLIKQSAFEGKNHSAIGALYLLFMLGEIENRAPKSFESDIEFRKRIRLVFELAALAILTHDIDSLGKQTNQKGNVVFFKKDLSIPFDEYPVCYLLGICDQLQDWGRRRVVREPTAEGVLEKAVIDCNAVDIKL